MNAEFPCISCSRCKICNDSCTLYVTYFRRLIKSYAKYGRRSLLMKYAYKQLSLKSLHKIKQYIDTFYNVKIIHKGSGHFYVISRHGIVVETGTK